MVNTSGGSSSANQKSNQNPAYSLPGAGKPNNPFNTPMKDSQGYTLPANNGRPSPNTGSNTVTNMGGTGRRGGGGGGSLPQSSVSNVTPASSTSNQQAQTAAVQAAADAARQRQIELNKQLNQNVVDVVPSYQKREYLSKIEAAKQAARNLFKGESREERLARAKSIVDTSGPQIEKKSFWERVIEPFKYTSDTVAKQSSGIYKKGTIAPGEKPTYTKQEIVDQRSLESSLEIMKIRGDAYKTAQEAVQSKKEELQNKINSGDLNLKDAEKQLKDFVDKRTIAVNEQLKEDKKLKAAEQRLSKAQNTYGDLSLTGTYKLAKEAPLVAEAGLLAASALIPGGQGIAAAELGATGIFKTTELQKKEAEGYKVKPSEYLDPALRLTGAGMFGGTALRAVEMGIVKEQVSSLGNAPVSFKQVQYVEGDSSLVFYQAQQKYGGLTKNIEGYGKVYKEGENNFILPIGEVRSKTTGEVWNYFNTDKGTKLFQVDKSLFGSKGKSITLTEENLKKFKIPFAENQPEVSSSISISASKNTIEPKMSASLLYGDSKQGVTKTKAFSKLGGETKESFGLGISREITPDLQGNRRFISYSESVDKNLKIQKQFGETTVIESQPRTKVSLFSGEGSRSKPNVKPLESKPDSLFGEGVKQDIKMQSESTLADSSLGIDLSTVTKESTQQSVSMLGEANAESKSTRLFGSKQEMKTEYKTTKAQRADSVSLFSEQLVAKEEQLQAPKTSGGLLDLQGESSGQSQFQIPSLSQSLIETPRQQTKQSLIAPPIQKPQPLSVINPGSIDLGLSLPSGIRGSLDSGRNERANSKRQGLFGDTKYNASLGAVLINKKPRKVTKREASLLANEKYSGLENRAPLQIIPDGVNTTKKRRKK